MIIRFVKRKAIYAFFPFFFKEENPYDIIDANQTTADVDAADKTGFQRLRSLFEKHPGKIAHPGVVETSQVAITTFILGGIYGGMLSSRTTFINFIEQNEATQFLNQHDAKRRLNDKMFTSFMRGLVNMGSKVSIFCTTLIASYTIISVYQNKDSAWYYTPAGSMAGAVYKFPLGPRGMIAGAFFGGIFGSIYGTIKWCTLTFTKLTEENFRQMHIDGRLRREEAIQERNRKYRDYQEEKKIMETIKEMDKMAK